MKKNKRSFRLKVVCNTVLSCAGIGMYLPVGTGGAMPTSDYFFETQLKFFIT